MEKYVIVGGESDQKKYYAVLPSSHSSSGELWWLRDCVGMKGKNKGYFTIEEATKFDTYDEAYNALSIQKQTWAKDSAPVWVKKPRVEKVDVDDETLKMISNPVEGYVIKYDSNVDAAGLAAIYVIDRNNIGDDFIWTDDLDKATVYIDETAANEALLNILRLSAVSAYHRFSIERINRNKPEGNKMKEENMTTEYNKMFARVNSTKRGTDDLRYMVIVLSENTNTMVYYIRRDQYALNDLQLILNYYSLSCKIRVFELHEKEVSVKVEIKDKYPTTRDIDTSCGITEHYTK